MSNVRGKLQQDVFLPSNERLIATTEVTKAGKKKKEKTTVLCLAVTLTDPVQVYIYLVRKSDRGDTYKKKTQWHAHELKRVDGKLGDKEQFDFDLVLDKLYRWSAVSSQDRYSFLAALFKVCQRHLIKKPEFVNVPEKITEDRNDQLSGGRGPGLGAGTPGEPLAEEYQALTRREEDDLAALMAQCGDAVSDATSFAEKLTRDLNVLDGANVEDIMGSEDQVNMLMTKIDKSLHEATRLEQRLDKYDNILQGVADYMAVMRDKDALLQVQSRNHTALAGLLDTTISALDLDHKHMMFLMEGDLSTPSGIASCTEAAEALQRALQADIHPALRKIKGVESQCKLLHKVKTNFTQKLSRQLNNLFIFHANELSGGAERRDCRLQPHHSQHRDTLPWVHLMGWLKDVDSHSFSQLKKIYATSLVRCYERELHDFFEATKMALAGKDKLKLLAGTGAKGSQDSLNKPLDRGRSGSKHSLDSREDTADAVARGRFDQVFDGVLGELEPYVLAEQDFCVKFFHLSLQKASGDELLSGESEKPPETPEEKQGDEEDIWQQRQQPQVEKKPPRRQINEEVRQMMGDLLPSLEPGLRALLAHSERLDPYHCLYMLVRMQQHVLNAQDAGSYLSTTFGSCLVEVKRGFDKFIQAKIESWRELKVSKKVRCGIIPFVVEFKEFATQAEAIFGGCERRSDIDRAYARLIDVVFSEITRVAASHPKTPREVVIMENCHYLHAGLSRLKIACLESERKDARSRYNSNLALYVTNMLGRPLEKLHIFLDGVRGLISQGVKEEEVSYQLAFNKQELRKVLKEYPGKEVKKGLEQLYRKVEKHLSEEENLLQVVWHSLQDEFLKLYKSYDSLLTQCYQGSDAKMEFTISDVLQYFSDIAHQH